MRTIGLSLLCVLCAFSVSAVWAAEDLDQEMYVESLGMRIQANGKGSVYKRLVKTCQHGVGQSCHFLGEFYRERNEPDLAKRFHGKGCDSKHVRSCLILGSIYLFDEDDRRAAETAFSYPCEQGEATACHNMGYLAKLRGDYPIAKRFYKKACSLGFQRSCEDLKSLQK